MIEQETKSLFSHAGILILGESGVLEVAHALGVVKKVSIEEFLKPLRPGTSASVYRSADLAPGDYLKRFTEGYEGLPYDYKFLWDNWTDDGREPMYCSEFIAKFLDYFLPSPTIPQPMTYRSNPDYWRRFFRGEPPEGAPGVSPASFSRDLRFKFIGFL